MTSGQVRLISQLVPSHRGLTRVVRIQVYKNLHLGTWSVRDPQTGRVLRHAAYVEIEGGICRVQQGARERVLRERRRSVHAYVVGEEVAHGDNSPPRLGAWTRFTYDPYRAATFTVADPAHPAPVLGAARMRFDAEGAWFSPGEERALEESSTVEHVTLATQPRSRDDGK
jgi:hypothetical protein